jgi:hypothetical protein
MALLAWLMMGIAIWHFTVFLPDRFWSGIVGAFIGASIGAVLSGLAVHGFSIPTQDDTTVLTVAEAIPGALIGMGLVWVIGDRQERARGTTETAPRI